MITDEQIEEIKEYLQGSCNTLDDAVQTICGDSYSEDDLSIEQIEDIENWTRECEQCNWWCETSEFSEGDGTICDDCYEEE